MINTLNNHIQSRPHNPTAQTWHLYAAILLFIAAVAVYWMPGGLETGFLDLQQLSWSTPEGLWSKITFIGDKWVALTLGLIIAVRYPRYLLTLLFAALLSTALAYGFKQLIDTPRPGASLPLDQFRQIGSVLLHTSTPSGHTTAAFTLAGLAMSLFRQPMCQALFLLLAALVGYSRIAVGVHWPVDVLSGAGLGLFSAWAAVWLGKRFETLLTPALYVIIVLCLIGSAIRLISYTGGFDNITLFAIAISAFCLGSFAGDVVRYWGRSDKLPAENPQA